MKSATAALGLTLLALPSAAFAEDFDSRIALKGIKAFSVVVESIAHEDDLRGALTKQGLRTAVELRLRQLGLPVKDRASCYLYVNVNTMLVAGPSVVYSLRVDFNEVFDSGDQRGPIAGATWERGSIGIRPFSTAREIQAEAVALVDEFANDFLAMNPPQPWQAK